MKTPTNFDEIEFALNNPDDGMMGDALKAFETLRAEFEAMQAVVEAANSVIVCNGSLTACKALSAALANLAKVKEGAK